MQFELKRFWNYLKEDVRRNFWLMLGLVFVFSAIGYSHMFYPNFKSLSNPNFHLGGNNIGHYETIYDYYRYIITLAALIIISVQYGDSKSYKAKSLRLTLPVSIMEKLVSIFVNVFLILPLIGLIFLVFFNFYLGTITHNNYITYEFDIMMSKWSNSLLFSNYGRYLLFVLGIGSVLIHLRKFTIFIIPIIWIVFVIIKSIVFLKSYKDSHNIEYYTSTIQLPIEENMIYYQCLIAISGILLLYTILKTRQLNERTLSNELL